MIKCCFFHSFVLVCFCVREAHRTVLCDEKRHTQKQSCSVIKGSQFAHETEYHASDKKYFVFVVFTGTNKGYAL